MSVPKSHGVSTPSIEPLRRRPANAVPRLPEWQERTVRAIAVITLAYWTYYIIWRWGWTLNPDALWFSIPLALAETWGLVTAFVMIHSVWRIRHRQPLPAPPGMTVDVFITCYDEPLEVIRRTAIGARAIRYPHKTYILDDGERDEVQAMAEELGLGYIRRLTHEHAKAGNLNHALKYTDGDFILQLDADHVPLPHILDRVLGFFAEDPRLAFVQTPQDFYNTDAFTYNVDEQSRRIWEEQRLFFGVIQAGKDNINCTFFCGCSAVIRRAALDSIGGFSVKTITEDIETSLVLHAGGWNSAFYGESLVYGLAAHNAVAFHTQHLRWGQGGMQVFKRFNPITYPGLSLAQRISYFGSLTAYVGGVQKLVYYASPLIFFFTGVLPIKAFNAEFLSRFLPFLFLSFLLSEAWARGRSNTWMSERFHMVKFWTYTRAVMSIFSRKEQKFKVTPKGPGHVPFKTYAPQVTVMVLSVVAVVWATLAYEFGWVDYRVEGWKSIAFLSNAFWASINFAVAVSVVRMSVRARTHRADHRFRDRFPVTLAITGAGGRTRSRIALAEDLNPGGMALRTPQALAEGTELRLTLPLSTATVTVKGKVLYSRPVEEKARRHRRPGGEAEAPAMPAYRSGIEFSTDMPMNVRDQIELHCTSHSVPLEQSQYSISSPTMFERTMDWVRNHRREQRRPVRMPATVQVGGRGRKRGKQRVGFLEEISAGGARLVMDEPVPPHTLVRFEVPGTGVRGTGRVVFARAIETPIGVRFAVGVQRRRRMDIGPGKGVERMEMTRVLGRAGKAAVAGLTLALAAPAGAQLEPVVYGATEFDSENLQLYLVGASVSSPGQGLGWTAGVSAFHLVFPSGEDETQTLNSITPAAGVRYGFNGGAVAGTLGYSFVSGEDDEDPTNVVGAPGGGEDGLVTQVQANYWGDGYRSGQAIALYNFGAEYYWTNFRGSQRILSTGDATGLNLGAEAGIQGGGDGDYQAFQAGGLVEYQMTPALRLVGVLGGKSDNRDGSPSLFPYIKLEAVALPRLF